MEADSKANLEIQRSPDNCEKGQQTRAPVTPALGRGHNLYHRDRGFGVT